MATTRIMPLHVGKGRTESRAISDIIDYVANPQKTDNGKLITGYACDSRTADAEFLLAKRQYIAATGRVRGADDVIAYHVRQSFKPGEITPEEANRLGVEFAKRFTKGNHAFVVCTHIDKSHIHNHIIWSSVSLEYDRKFRNFWGSTKAVRRLSGTICIENGLSIVENPKLHGKSYNKWLGDQAKPSHRELLRVAIDNALSQSPIDFEELLKLLQESGCEVSKRGKSYRLKLPGWEKAARIDSLGEGYGLEDLQAVLSGKKAHTPRKKTVTQAEPPKINLLVDIQAKLQAGKGAGYARCSLETEAAAVNGKPVIRGDDPVFNATPVFLPVIPVFVVTRANAGFGLTEWAAEFLPGTIIVGGFAIFVHSQSSITDQVTCRKSFALGIAFFEGDKSFPIIDRFHGVVDAFRVVALIREKGTSLQREDLVGCGEDVNGNCGIHDVGLGGQLVEWQAGDAVHQHMAFVSPVELIPPLIVLVGGRMDAQSVVRVAFGVVFLGELAFRKGLRVVLLRVRHDGCGIQTNERRIHHAQLIQLPHQIGHNRLQRTVVQLPQETVIGPVGRQRLHDVETAVVGNKPVIVQIIRQICDL